MKKLATLFAAAMLTVSVSAQTVQESKTFDNVYLGINAGLATKTTDHGQRTLHPTSAFVLVVTLLRYGVSQLRATSTSRLQMASQLALSLTL